jgi:hypothetical protein
MRAPGAILFGLLLAGCSTGSMGSLKAKGSAGAGGAAGDAGAGLDGTAGTGGTGGVGAGGNTTGGAGGSTVGAPCTPDGSFACAGPAQARVVQCASGTWHKAAECTNGQLCDSSLPATDANRCATPVADCLGQAPGSIVCAGAERVKCGPDLVSTTTLASCDSAELCLLGSGDQCAACKDGEYRCTGPTLEKCSAGHTSFVTVQTCQSDALCNAGARTCTTAACISGQYQCSGAMLEKCNASQSGFSSVQTCLSASLCDATNGQCDVCVPGAMSCKTGSTSRVCNPDGQGYKNTLCPANTPSCTGQGVCVCTVNSTCGYGYACVNGKCESACGVTCTKGCFCNFQTQSCEPIKAGTLCP